MKRNAGIHREPMHDYSTLMAGRPREAGLRALAEGLDCDAMARLGLSRREQRALTDWLREARRLSARGDETDAALRRLAEASRQIEANAAQARAGAGVRLPSRRGVPRVAVIADALLDSGESGLTEAALLDGLRAVDAARPLTQRELWAVPEALRLAVVHGLERVAASIVRSGRRCAEAARWTARPSRVPVGRGADFYERALMLCAEYELSEARARLERGLRAMGLSPEQVIRQAHDARARDLMRLENLMSASRLADALDWPACFEKLSGLEAELRRDPAGVYPRMDDASRQAVRDAVTDIARRAGMSEQAVARGANAAARSAAAAPGTPASDKAADAAASGMPGAEASANPVALRGGVCWWLYDDAGRRALLERMGRPGVRLPKRVPDPSGKGCMLAQAALASALFALLAAWLERAWLWPAFALLAWNAAGAVIAAVFPRLFRPARLLKLEIERVPDALRTLVVMPVLISDAARAAEVCDGLEAMSWLDRDENIEYLLLSDFADAKTADMPGDAALLADIGARIERMNRRHGRSRCHWLHRPRVLLEADGRYMGRDRKRGALMALNRLLLGEAGAEAAFLPGEAIERLRGRFCYVVTLDADTRMLPGTVKRLVGAMAHPMNRPDGRRGWAVMQPRMELMPSACVNGFVRLFCGAGGVDTYPTAASSLWMDITGHGAYAGKGIYDIAAFHAALEGALPEGRILSHDLVEGAIAGAATLGDVALYDAGPASLGGWLRRLHRWTRGDWQLLPLIMRRRPLPNGRRLRAADRFRMADNLLRSLRAPALWLLLAASAWRGDADMLAAGMLANYLEPILRLFDRDALKWRRATAELAILPAAAFNLLDAALRALWRVGVSGKHLLDWVPSADAEGGGRDGDRPNRVAAALILPGLLTPGAAPQVVALAAIFWVGAGWVRGMAEAPVDDAAGLSDGQRRMLIGLARDTWRFFERSVPLGGAALPPDNAQVDPEAGPVRRTSPTNIGLYMLSCVAAARLGVIGADEARARLSAALDAVDRAEKWRGHLYNWIDIDRLEALRPHYVSAVDSGNLAACAIACAKAASAWDAALSDRLRALAEGMDFAALYDPRRNLFHIGMDAETDRLSQSHYDLLASEARTLSYVAVMLGQAPAKHWARLGRGCAAVAGTGVLRSWSGTMFEYLMPELLLRAPALSLVGQSCRGAVAEQVRHGLRRGCPWGVSESGYHAFDMHMNYQYRAFGLPSLALGGQAVAGVVAPYASALALAVRPAQAADNLARMAALGWRGECGFYEAADGLRPDEGGAPSVVKSHMAHHQGMILCAICNALTGDALAADFMADPRARAHALLLEERACPAPRRGMPEAAPAPAGGQRGREYGRTLRGEGRLADTHLLRGRDASAVVTADGGVHYARAGVDATRFSGDLAERYDAACVHLVDDTDGRAMVLGGGDCRISCDAGAISYDGRLGRVTAEMRVSLSPEDDTLFRALTLTNAGSAVARLRAVDIVPAALAASRDWRAHPAFQNLFVEAEHLGARGNVLRRRPRNPGERCPALVHMACADGAVKRSFDFEALVGRTGDTRRAHGISYALTGQTGSPLNPASALCAEITLAPGETARLHFALKLLEPGEDAAAWLERCGGADAPERAARLNRARTEAMLGYLGIAPTRAWRLDRLAALLLDGRLAASAKAQDGPADSASRQTLWSMGLSGDRPIISMTVRDPRHADAARALLQAHAFYRAMGIDADLALVDDCAGGYDRPGRDMLTGLIAASDLCGRERTPGGVWLLDGGALSDAQRAALARASAISLDAAADFDAALRALLGTLEARPGAARPLDAGMSQLTDERRFMFNGYGGFGDDGSYVIDVLPDRLPPVAWSNLLANDRLGILLTERGGGFMWHANSRSGRLTAWRGDALREGWGLMLYLYNAGTRELLRLLPGDRPALPYRARFSPDRARYAFDAARLAGAVTVGVGDDAIIVEVNLENRGLRPGNWRVVCLVDWLMGTDAGDAAWLHSWAADGACFASGASEGIAWLASDRAEAAPGPARARLLGGGGLMLPGGLDETARPGGDCLSVPVSLKRGVDERLRFGVGWASDIEAAHAMARAFSEGDAGHLPEQQPPKLLVRTPDEALNRMMSVFLPHQAKASRVLGRTGLYQPGGAYGFRDQLQDMLALLPTEPERVRAHLLGCAARQFEAGDALHWWHEPWLGVRTRISDDRLFLPYVTAAYVAQTGDRAVLEETVPYLEDMPIPEGREDLFCEMRPGSAVGTLHEHCMRAFRASDAVGAHGLALMGAGDWNDGMNRVGADGRGESVWLSEFIAACAEAYAEIAPDEASRARLVDLAGRHRAAVEAHGWDGAWYRRAYTDDGTPLGSDSCRECRIDLIAQAWAVLAGLDAGRCQSAMDAAWNLLADEEQGVIRLLTPPYDGGSDPGYIAGYPAGVRENGAQYTHAACWLLLALARMGDAGRAHRALRMLLPPNHAGTPEKARRYRVEPYVTAADIYAMPGREGQGGWTWYTGSAAWLYVAVLELLGYERRGDRARLNALLGDWPEAGVALRYGGSTYALVCDRETEAVTLDGRPVEGAYIRMTDDGQAHEARFPARDGLRRAELSGTMEKSRASGDTEG